MIEPALPTADRTIPEQRSARATFLLSGRDVGDFPDLFAGAAKQMGMATFTEPWDVSTPLRRAGLNVQPVQ